MRCRFIIYCKNVIWITSAIHLFVSKRWYLLFEQNRFINTIIWFLCDFLRIWRLRLLYTVALLPFRPHHQWSNFLLSIFMFLDVLVGKHNHSGRILDGVCKRVKITWDEKTCKHPHHQQHHHVYVLLLIWTWVKNFDVHVIICDITFSVNAFL